MFCYQYLDIPMRPDQRDTPVLSRPVHCKRSSLCWFSTRKAKALHFVCGHELFSPFFTRKKTSCLIWI